MTYNFEEIKKSLKKAINKLKNNDSFLLQIDSNERTISHKLAEYLQQEFQDWNVDCEYNRKLESFKRLELPKDKINWDDTEAKTVFPDIIIHKRNTNENLLVIEMKKSSSSADRNFDKNKLKAFTKGDYSYTLGLFIEFYVGSNADKEPLIEWYEKGELTNEN